MMFCYLLKIAQYVICYNCNSTTTSTKPYRNKQYSFICTGTFEMASFQSFMAWPTLLSSEQSELELIFTKIIFKESTIWMNTLMHDVN